MALPAPPPGFNLDAEKAAAEALARGGVDLSGINSRDPEPEFDGEDPDPKFDGKAADGDDEAIEDKTDNGPIGEI